MPLISLHMHNQPAKDDIMKISEEEPQHQSSSASGMNAYDENAESTRIIRIANLSWLFEKRNKEYHADEEPFGNAVGTESL